MNFLKSWVPRGSSLRMYSAPMIASSQALGLRLMVEKNTVPPGLTRRWQAAITEAGSGTCSSISRQVTTSKRPGISSARASAVLCR